MFTLYKHEIRLYIKSLIIWTLSVGGMGVACILLFSSMEGQMSDMAASFASMGAFSDAFGMSQLSIATLEGFYATEVGTIHGLGGAMFAAIIGTVALSKEEDGHTSEFLYTLPVSRKKVITAKLGAVVTNILVFNLACVSLYVLGFAVLGENVSTKEFALYHFMQFIMQLEIAGICFCISSCMRKNKLGLGLGVVLLFYAYDLMARVIPTMSDYKIISPFSYANAADVFSTGEVTASALIIGLIISLISIASAYTIYSKRDFAA